MHRNERHKRKSALVRLSKAAKMLAEAKSLDEVLKIRDVATAAAAYAKAARLGLEMQNDAAEVKIRAERKAGEMLLKMPRNEGGHSPHRETGSPPSYEELGIERNQAHRWQKEAMLPEKDFNAYLNAAKESKQEITSKAVYNLAKSFEKGDGAVWSAPKMAGIQQGEAMDALIFGMIKQAIREAASGEFGVEPAEWLLETEYRLTLEKKEIPVELIDDWVKSGCKSTPLHEVLISTLNNRWGWSDD